MTPTYGHKETEGKKTDQREITNSQSEFSHKHRTVHTYSWCVHYICSPNGVTRIQPCQSSQRNPSSKSYLNKQLELDLKPCLGTGLLFTI